MKKKKTDALSKATDCFNECLYFSNKELDRPDPIKIPIKKDFENNLKLLKHKLEKRLAIIDDELELLENPTSSRSRAMIKKAQDLSWIDWL